MKATRLTILAFAALASVSSAYGNTEDVNKIIDEGKNRNQVMKHLDELTHKIGPRLTGSPGLKRAQDWAVGKFKSFGIKNARLEQWGDVPLGFERGNTQIGRMTEPYERDIVFTTMNWTVGTKGLQRGKAILAPKDIAEFEKKKDMYKGAWVIMTSAASMRGAQDNSDAALKKALDEASILGRIYGTRDERVHSSGSWRDKTFEKYPKDLNIMVQKSAYDRIVRNLEFERDVNLEFNIENRFIKGPVPQYNVIADIPGTEKPDEMVIVCGHLDSWNSPGSQGACDNGTGSVNAIEAARILMAAGVKPKRTIRFILWSGEEQGLLGSRAYVDKHKDEHDKISAVLNDDGGTNYQGGYSGIASQKEMMEAAFGPTNAAFPGMTQEFQVTPSMPSGGSSDHAAFNWVGVPGFFTMEKGRSDYGFVWHTQNDRYEYAIPEYLVQSSTNHAVVSFNLANAATLLPRGPKPAPRTTTAASLNHALAMGADRMYNDPYYALQEMFEHASQRHKDHDHEDDYVMYLVDSVKRFATQVATSVRK